MIRKPFIRKPAGSIKLLLALILCAACAAGCSKSNEQEQARTPEMSPGLSRMQGNWIAASTNEGCTATCGVLIDGHAVRIRYQESADAPVIRESAVIDRIDEQKKLLIINGGIGAWPYVHGTEDGREHLEIEFHVRSLGEWRRMHLKRSA